MQSDLTISPQQELSAHRMGPRLEDVGTPTPQIDLSRKPKISESVIQGFLFFCGAVSILTTLGIIYVLAQEAATFFEIAPLTANLDLGAFQLSIPYWIEGLNIARFTEFFTRTTWQPQIFKFGIWPLLISTILTSFIAMLVALPLGLMIAIYLSEYASNRIRSILKPILEVLAGIPTVVYGYFALTFMTPLLRGIFGFETVEIYNTAAAGLVIGILILPLVTSMSEDALGAVPQALRQAAYALGATRLETALRVVLPAALSGITAAFIVAISRAIGETMIVAIAAGAGPRNFDTWGDATSGLAAFNPFKAAETMTGHIVRISGGDISYESLDYSSLFAIGLLLFAMTLGLNILSRILVTRFREEYD